MCDRNTSRTLVKETKCNTMCSLRAVPWLHDYVMGLHAGYTMRWCAIPRYVNVFSFRNELIETTNTDIHKAPLHRCIVGVWQLVKNMDHSETETRGVYPQVFTCCAHTCYWTMCIYLVPQCGIAMVLGLFQTPDKTDKVKIITYFAIANTCKKLRSNYRNRTIDCSVTWP